MYRVWRRGLYRRAGDGGNLSPRRLFKRLLVILAAAALALGLVYWKYAGAIAIGFGSAIWIPVSADTFWLPHSLSLALRNPAPEATPGPVAWTTPREGFQAGRLPALVDGETVDEIVLGRIDPAKFRFEVLNQPNGKRRLSDWLRETGAALIVNGSYYDRVGRPATPIVSKGVFAGPAAYTSQHGAFIAKGGQARIADLTQEDWQAAFKDAQAGIVSYPLLIAPDGSTGRPARSRWLANRSFVAVDDQGWVVIGTTASAFFSLDRLATFLKASPLRLKAALNLDGGPVACQGVALGPVQLKQYGLWEIQADDASAKMLPPAILSGAPMPLVLAVFPPH
jgi:hypothetical protein